MKKNLGFTLAEILIVVGVMGIIIGSTVLMVFKTSNINVKKIQMSSQSFYSNIENTFREIVLYETRGKGVRELKPSELMDYFVNYMDGQNIIDSEGVAGDCSMFTVGADFADYLKEDTKEESEEEEEEPEIKEGTKCAEFSPSIIAGFYLDEKCEEEVTIKEFPSGDKPERNVTNACGYIIYEPLKSTGTFGEP